ncbi:probable peroxisomal membrane protein MPV17 and related proteins [Ramularia collo-cygni]|uniref:Probable peroxisomal membrane protein MPV17 and related proteins n=1 Tax=Ramularia collo-cygni TaxID=112498 RepID=A0A2D3VNR1_9PEZI|nr:probable peroxisomal membrane protein MPV17 and related proteins [Ramularia collo-cygni]CZT24574.1 probable peroxisomal membrane protein MPV17 and related proteins [Ramularia collo-cygni]
MVISETRKRVMRQLNSRYIYGRYPLLHAIVALIQLTMVSILVRKFNGYYASRPVMTTMITNAVLGGIADTVAQTLTAIRLRQRQKALNPNSDTREDFMSVEIQDLDKKVPWPADDYMTPASKRGPPPFDFERLIRFMAYGFMMAPVQHKWFGMLHRLFPIENGKGTANALRRVALDQFIFAPIGLAVFFTFMTVAEGGGRRAVVRKFQDVYLPSLKANFIVWPLVQVLNFRVMPIQFQIPFVSTIGIFWTAYLSMNNASEEPMATPGASPA